MSKSIHISDKLHLLLKIFCVQKNIKLSEAVEAIIENELSRQGVTIELDGK